MKYHITTYGCQMNQSDSERIASILNCVGYNPTANQNEADIIIINSCSVRQSAIDRVYGQLRNLSPGKMKILTGCVLPKEKDELKKKFDLILDVKDLTNLPSLIMSLRADQTPIEQAIVSSSDNELLNYLNITPDYQNKFSAFVPIMTGCNNFCTYCAVPYTRGREISRPAEEIKKEAENLIRNKYKEIWLLGQNVNSYSTIAPPNSIAFPELLRLVDNIPGNFWIRFTSPHPKDFSNDLINALDECEKMTEYINLPVQAGDDQVLKKMNRPYTIEYYINLVRKIREKNPTIAISTDIIVGFPGETDEQFNNTLKLFEEIKYDMAYISQYSPRAGTAAAQFEDSVPREEKIRRDKELTQILAKTALDNNRKYLNGTVDVLVEKEKKNVYLGKTRAYKTVKFPKTQEGLIGRFVKVKIIDAGAWGLKGKLI